MHPMLLIGLNLNTVLILINRKYDLGNFSIPLHLVAIGLMVAGLIFTLKQ